MTDFCKGPPNDRIRTTYKWDDESDDEGNGGSGNGNNGGKGGGNGGDGGWWGNWGGRWGNGGPELRAFPCFWKRNSFEKTRHQNAIDHIKQENIKISRHSVSLSKLKSTPKLQMMA